MNRKISVSLGGWKEEKEIFAYNKSCGFDAVEYALGGHFGAGRWMANATDEEIKERFTYLKTLADKAGLEIGQTHSAFGGHFNPAGHPDDLNHNFDFVVDQQIKCIMATHWLGAKYCVIHPPILPGRKYDLKVQENYDFTIEFYSKLIPALEKYDVYCCIENMFAGDWQHRHMCSTICSHAEEMVALCEQLGDRFRVCLDIGHSVLAEQNPAEMIRVIGDKLACLHVHDNDGVGDLHTYPFAVVGTKHNFKPMRVNWYEVMEALDEVNYQGNFNFEIGVPGPRALHRAGFEYLAEIGRYLVSLRKDEEN